MLRPLAALVVLVISPACNHDCIEIPGCVPPVAVTITVTSSATHAPVNGITLRVSGAGTTVTTCNGSCAVMGGPGRYVISIEAPGFQNTERTVNVNTSGPRTYNVYGPTGYEGRSCGCATVNRETIDVALVPLAS